jgi:hypothetical protein
MSHDKTSIVERYVYEKLELMRKEGLGLLVLFCYFKRKEKERKRKKEKEKN